MALHTRRPRRARNKHIRPRSRNRPHSINQHDQSTDQRTQAATAFHHLPTLSRKQRRADLLSLQRTVGNRAVQRLLVQREDIYEGDSEPQEDIYEGEAAQQEETHEADSVEQEEIPSVTGYVGLNPEAWKEARGLEYTALERVITSLDSPQAEKGFDTREKRIAWVMDLLEKNALDFYEDFMLVWRALEEADPAFREQMGDLMKIFAAAEKGEYRLERLVMSGHSNGIALWGETDDKHNPGTFFIDADFSNLVRAFPKAASQVQDIMFSGCFTINAIEGCKRLFPNLQSAWAYGGYSPSIQQGSALQISKFEKETRGESVPTATGKSGSTAVWTRQNGYIVGDPSDVNVDSLRVQLSNRLPFVASMNNGDAPLDKAFLREYYSILHQLINHPECDSEERNRYEIDKERILRLRHWEQVLLRFEAKHQEQMKAVYAEIGLPLPRLTDMTRRDLLSHLHQYQQALSNNPSASAKEFFDNLLNKGLWVLHPDVIPEAWT